jgi:hypothetical protein
MEYDFFSGNRMWIPSVFRLAVSERSPNLTRQTGAPGVLVVTADDKFYYLLLSLAIDLGWSILRARNLVSAEEHMTSHPMPIVVYDERLPYSHWRDGLRALSSLGGRPLILLATRRLDEDIWRIVLECKGYDALERAARKEEWTRMLRFAWLSFCRPAEEPDCLPAAILSNRT